MPISRPRTGTSAVRRSSDSGRQPESIPANFGHSFGKLTAKRIAAQPAKEVPWTADAELLVVAEIVEDTHHAEETGAPDGIFTDRYEYTVALRAVLKRERATIGVYEATGKYRAEATESESVPDSEARQYAWDHALRLLAAKMKSDRERIVEGKIKKFIAERALTEQLFVKDDSKTVGQLVKEASGTLGEAISIKRFARFRIGEE